MLIESTEIKKILYTLKQESKILLDRHMTDKVKHVIENRISILESLLIWIDKSESKGDIDMADLKLGQVTTWEPRRKEGGIDALIIEATKSEKLRKNYDAIRVDIKTVTWNTFQNRVYSLRSDGTIKENFVPRKDSNGIPHLVYMDPAPVQRSKGK